eukprot:scaffold264024_cov40-Prasinocladus_malaysianus.AAC.1
MLAPTLPHPATCSAQVAAVTRTRGLGFVHPGCSARLHSPRTVPFHGTQAPPNPMVATHAAGGSSAPGCSDREAPSMLPGDPSLVMHTNVSLDKEQKMKMQIIQASNTDTYQQIRGEHLCRGGCDLMLPWAPSR